MADERDNATALKQKQYHDLYDRSRQLTDLLEKLIDHPDEDVRALLVLVEDLKATTQAVLSLDHTLAIVMRRSIRMLEILTEKGIMPPGLI